MERIKKIDDLFRKAGGPNKLAAKLGVHQLTVERWHIRGIPYKWWNAISKEYGLGITDLHTINQEIIKNYTY